MVGRIVALTVTGGRHEAWEHCKRWMSNQTLKPDLWVIVDDCLPAQVMDIDFCHIAVIYPDKIWHPGDNSQAVNILEGLKMVRPCDKLIIIEDDDYYSPAYIEKMVKWLDSADLVGELNALYYNVKTRTWKNCNNRHHASLCSTSLTGTAIDALRDSCGVNKFIDLTLWNKFKVKKRLYSTRYSVGIKGLPGRAGIGIGHTMRGVPDPSWGVLRKILGNDAEFYIRASEAVIK